MDEYWAWMIVCPSGGDNLDYAVDQVLADTKLPDGVLVDKVGTIHHTWELKVKSDPEYIINHFGRVASIMIQFYRKGLILKPLGSNAEKK